MATKETYKTTKDIEHEDKPKTKDTINIDLKVKYIGIFNEALLKYLGPEYTSHIQVSKSTKALFSRDSKELASSHDPKVSACSKGSKGKGPSYDFNDQLYNMTVLGSFTKDRFIIPTTSLKRLLVVEELPESDVVFIEYKSTGTVVFSFLRFEDCEIKLSSPHLEDNVNSEDEIPCKHSDDITPHLTSKDPIDSLLVFFSTFFSLGTKPDLQPYQWELVGTDQDCKISQKVGTTVFYWKDTDVNEIVEVVDSEAGAMSFRMDQLL